MVQTSNFSNFSNFFPTLLISGIHKVPGIKLSKGKLRVGMSRDQVLTSITKLLYCGQETVHTERRTLIAVHSVWWAKSGYWMSAAFSWLHLAEVDLGYILSVILFKAKECMSITSGHMKLVLHWGWKEGFGEWCTIFNHNLKESNYWFFAFWCFSSFCTLLISKSFSSQIWHLSCASAS